MTPRNSRTNRSAARSSRVPQSARAVRSARAAQSGRIASRSDASSFGNSAPAGGYRPAYTPDSQGGRANTAYGRQADATQYSRTNPAYSKAAKKKMSRGKKAAIGVVAALLAVLVGGGSAFALWMNSVNESLTKGDKTEEELSALQDVLVAPTSYSEPFYMMLIGSDARADDASMGARSDTNIVARVDPANAQVTLISIPRDTQIDIDGYGVDKFNAIYNYSGAAGVVKEANQLLGIEISHYAEVNFEELVALVDAVGGVDVEVDEIIDDEKAGSVVIEEGLQHLDGEAALVFARSRQYVDGDFTRTANQRKLIGALAEKVISLPVTELPGVISSAAQCVTTDMSVNDIISLAQQFQEAGDLTVYSAMVPSVTGYENEISYVYTDEASLAEMMKIVEEGGDPSGITASADAYANVPSSSSGTSTGDTSGDVYYDDTTYSDGTYYYDDGSGGTGVGDGTGYDDSYVDPNASGGGYYDDGSGGTYDDTSTYSGAGT